MQRRTPIFIVTSSRPRVGKTLIARALTEYFCAQSRPVSAFDVNPGEFKLAESLPDYAVAASLDDTRGEMALFDQLVADDGVPKVVDLGNMALDRFLAVMQQIGFRAEALRRGVVPMVLFVADTDERASRGYARLAAAYPDLPLVAVFNEYVPQITWHRDEFPPTRRGGEPMTVPALTPVVRSVVDRKNFSFIGYASKADTTSELFGWMRDVFLGFREIEVRLLLGEIAPQQLKHSA